MSNAEREPIIVVDRLTHIYPTQGGEGHKALDNVSLEIYPGEFVAIIGHNGSGKSTLAKHLNAILLPTEGDVRVGGISTRDQARVWDIRQMVGMVFQNPDNQIVATTVEEDVAFGPENLGVPPAEIRLRVDQALELVRMREYAGHEPHLLSGGQKQRVAIAGVLAMRPKVMVMDEATAMLDPTGRLEVMATAKRLVREEGIAVVHITHFMAEAVEADRVVVMDHGKIVMCGTPSEVFARVDELKKMHLDVPQVTLVARELARQGLWQGSLPLTVDEMAAAIEAMVIGDRGSPNRGGG